MGAEQLKRTVSCCQSKRLKVVHVCLAGTNRNQQESREEDDAGAMGWPGLHGHTVWHLGPAYLVGILLGHHGAGHLFHHLRKCHGHVRVFRDDAPGEHSSRFTNRNRASRPVLSSLLALRDRFSLCNSVWPEI